MKACMPKEGETGNAHHDRLMEMLKEDEATVTAQKRFYEQADADMDEKLNATECAVFQKSLMGEDCSTEIIDKWNKAMACLDATSGAEHSWEDFCRAKKILAAWIASPKGDCLRPAAAPAPEAKAAAAAHPEGQGNKMH